MRILISGGSGKLGSILARILSQNGQGVSVFDLPIVDFSRVADLPNVEVFKGDITQYPQVREAMEGIDGVIHLAALLPPQSEKNPQRTMAVNVSGTDNILKAMREVSPNARIVFSSSVSVYGNTATEKPPIHTNHPLVASDNYSDTKIRSEAAIVGSGLSYYIMRISGVWATEVFEFPEVLQFRADQRVEFVDREDVALALASAIENPRCRNRVLNIAGGKTWQMTGGELVERLCDAIGVDVEVKFPEEHGWFDWYDTSESQRTLGYQRTSFHDFLVKLRGVFMEFLGR